MADIRLSQESYTDYSAVRYFAALGVENLKMEVKQVTIEKTGEIVPLIHLSGVQNSTGVILNFDMWPRNEMAGKDFENLPKTISELHFRLGRRAVYNPTTQQDEIIESAPKWLVLNPDSENAFKPSGEKREFIG